MALEAFQRANSLFVDENYNEALEQYNRAISLDSLRAEFFVKRSACLYKLGKHEEARKDAQRAIELEPANAQAYLRKGMACYSLSDYVEARDAFRSGDSVAPSSQFKSWIQKCEEAIAKLPALQSAASSSPATQSDIDFKNTNVGASSLAKRIRHEWYQNQTHVFVTIFAKGVHPGDAVVHFEERALEVRIKMSDSSEYVLDIQLCDRIVPSESSYEVLSTKLEVKLKKGSVANWASLEDRGDGSVLKTRQWDDASKVNKHEYPSSAKKKTNWEQLSKDVPEDKLEGEAALNKLFQDIYAGGTDEQRRAMIKSFVESGGTVLSTNWDEVKKGPVKGSPPKGMEMHYWSELEHGK